MLLKCSFWWVLLVVALSVVIYRINLDDDLCCSFRWFCKRFLVSLFNIQQKRLALKFSSFCFFVFVKLFDKGFGLYIPTSFSVHLALRGLLGLVSVSVTYAGLILAIEFVDGKWRTIAGMYNLFPLPISYMIISGIAYLTQDFRLLQLCIAIPGIFLCFLW